MFTLLLPSPNACAASTRWWYRILKDLRVKQ